MGKMFSLRSGAASTQNVTRLQAIQNAKSIRADPAKGLLIGGQSAGANFPAVITHRAKIDPFFVDCPITGQVLQIPVLLHPDAIPEQ